MEELTSFVTSGFEGVISPMERVTHEVLAGWNLIVVAVVLLLVVLNKQLYPRQFWQLLGVPSGVSHTNQLLREWTPTTSFIGYAFYMSYVVMVALLLQKAFVIFSRDVVQYNGFSFFSILCGCVAGSVALRYLAFVIISWLFQQKDIVVRQTTVDLSISTYSFMALLIVVLLVFYVPNTIFVWIGIGILFVSALVKLFLEIIETRVFSKMPSFYIFLYFCTLEIAPVVLLFVAGVRFFTNNIVF